jgi:hypothetical protein
MSLQSACTGDHGLSRENTTAPSLFIICLLIGHWQVETHSTVFHRWEEEKKTQEVAKLSIGVVAFDRHDLILFVSQHWMDGLEDAVARGGKPKDPTIPRLNIVGTGFDEPDCPDGWCNMDPLAPQNKNKVQHQHSLKSSTNWPSQT